MSRSVQFIHSLNLLFFFGFFPVASSQNSLPPENEPTVTISGFTDVYYIHDFQGSTGIKRQEFLYNHNRNAQAKINLSILSLSINRSRFRSNFGIQAGTYVNDNYAEEPNYIRNIHEANMGILLHKKNQLWLDLGVMPSYIGFESALSNQNWTYTRSLLAENSPYFVSGAKLSWKPNYQWNFTAMIVNGWQRITPLTGNTQASLGTQIQYIFKENQFLNWSAFIGSDDPNSYQRQRLFNNFYFISPINHQWALTLGFDIGLQQKQPGVQKFNVWHSPVIILKYETHKNWRICGRLEYYQDPNGVIISLPQNENFKAWGGSLNFDYFPIKQCAIRMEARHIYRPNIQNQALPHSIAFNQILAGSVCFFFNSVD